ncbi:bifunctional histidinol-phosphatase/imidazoleglycerol-phosphate dehydratase HisB [Ginsengibacter hankyongi]|uniref:Histidine biosynthesis bifunctional protein HisB n=1 Tax=Ginsengibacter hankyongi TaxID=2607284 RepID=A0A5J5IJC1_9BACT|nr:bifunctional histidinol-phosphatase/imidazoleglycerol-phosphate dehydratase HisB [Ginsengibacter hankyongi]KAA9040483.1 bifunctional histidinol-phosphatase/imidazoleglycerol-phosphate dehydratase HisB [Ginsengibacter hankyongi]
MTKRILFIDRDGTLIKEAPPTYQLDAFAKLEFYPYMFEYLTKIVNDLDYELVMVTNQDGLGTPSFPEDAFWPIQNFVLKALENEGIIFSEICIDRTFTYENKPTRKPGIGMLTKYFDADKYDLKNSFVIGDRLTDVKLAENLGSRAFWLNNHDNLGAGELDITANELNNVIALETQHWKDIYEYLKIPPRNINHVRNTNETKIEIELNLDGTGVSKIETGLGFFNHMLDQLARHSGIDLTVTCKGDLHIDEHHTIEDVGIALGEAFLLALGNKKGIERYGFLLPMDDCLAQVAIDFGGRNWLVWEADFKREKIGEMPTEMFYHFFKSFSDASKCNLNIKAEGTNEHHKIESIFKAFAKSIKMAIKRDIQNNSLPTTKGVL